MDARAFHLRLIAPYMAREERKLRARVFPLRKLHARGRLKANLARDPDTRWIPMGKFPRSANEG